MNGPVLVVGCGLLGTSVGLALSAQGVEVWLDDLDPEHLRTATGLGAGVPVADPSGAAVVVVAVPPDHLGSTVVDALRSTRGVVTDVGSVKSAPLDVVAASVTPEELSRYVGSHPMAGSERSGPLAAAATLFDGRPWAVTPHESASPDAVEAVIALVELCGAQPFTFSPEAHDEAVARTSHVPHVMAALVAARLALAPADHLALSGQGVRDVTRIAAGDPALWEQILTANSAAVSRLLREVRADLDRMLSALESTDEASRPALGSLLASGVAGTAAIPGKHGGPARPTRSVFVSVPDHPGELARLFGDAGEIGVNIEDVHIDHDPGRPVGLTELVVEKGSAERLLAALESRGWTTHR